MLKDRGELIRAAAVAAIAMHGPEAAVLRAASDASWRVRLKVAVALAGYTDAAATAAARRMLGDPSAEVERQVVRSLASWPAEKAAPVLLDALASDAVSVRKLAAEQLAARWHMDARFPYESPPARRAEALAELRARFQREYATLAGLTEPQGSAGQAGKPDVHASAKDQQVENLVNSGDIAALAAIGPEVAGSLERLAIDRHLTLPEAVYRDILPRYSTSFAALDRLHDSNLAARRQAAEDFAALAKNQPPGKLAIARLSALMTSETDSVVWLKALEVISRENCEPAVRLARLALSQKSGEVRRKACEYLAAHGDPAHEPFLAPLLADSEQDVKIAAIRAVASAGRIRDIAALKAGLASPDEEIQLATAVALLRLGDPAGDDAIGRLSYSSDIRTRGQLAQALGELGDQRFAGLLVRLLDDSKATVRLAALAGLPRVAGRDVTLSADGTSVSVNEQIARWKKWQAEGGKLTECR